MTKTATFKPIYRAALMAVAWVGILTSIALSISGRPADSTALDALLSTLSFFTIQTNILVALWLTWTVVHRDDHPLLQPAVRGALTVYITVTFLVYAVVLAPLWEPQGLTLFMTTVTHYVTPLGFILDWVLFEQRRIYQWRYIPYWLIYPIAYLIFSQIKGAITGNYLYPFLNTANIGWDGLAINVVGLVVFFVILSSAYIGVNKALRPAGV